ncbi:acyl-CoA thioesterase 9, tandem duplicate 1 isoform X2 [Phyllopteryx taeniolatus]|uniref:acyl-CoA thioesterase 9, tandem duplicate 1 isoform X2 n=1 Tax=Phyllopteryx taeniolatus TaxID=161469 RepID=UPI002AD3D6BE|nr:acyl-CoA thioesterase 9, tandem duplicate 1 isoform X2 [Phyllopteryx taeniolatus]
MFSKRLMTCLRPCASLTSRRLLCAEAKGTAPDMAEVRKRLREIVGASTNWSDHRQAMSERVSLSSTLARSQSELPARSMKDSLVEVHLPLGSQPQLREKYLTFHNTVRFGRILEDLDSLAVLISYAHTYNPALKRSPLSIVTALVDKIDMRQQAIYPGCDIKFTGHVTWVGKTSIEAKMHMTQYRNGAYSPVLDATFVMVARDPENKRAAFVNPLSPEGPEEEELFRQGEGRRGRVARDAGRDPSPLSCVCALCSEQVPSGGAQHRVPPEGGAHGRGEEHRPRPLPQHARRQVRGRSLAWTSATRLARSARCLRCRRGLCVRCRTVSFRGRLLPPDSVWMEDAKLKGLEICHPQERNIFNRIFGGFLMRKAYELGWANACAFGGGRPGLVAVDDILFQKPVEIGSLLLLSSQVCYTEGKHIQVRVHSEVFDPLTRQHNTTNVFHFTFASDRHVPNVVPRTYGESMLYLDGKRHFNHTVEY